MTLKKKILLGYGVAFALMGLVVVWAVMNLVSLGQATDAILRENYRSILAAEKMVDALEQQDSGIFLVLLGSRDKGIARFRENEAEFLAWLARAKDNITVEGEAELVESIDSDYALYRGRFSELIDSGDATALSSTAYETSIYPLFSKVRQAIITLRDLNEKTMYAASITAGRVAERAIWSTVLVAASVMTLALLLSLFFAERIVRPLRGFMAASRKISAGDYSVQVPVETSDELGGLAGEFNRMAAQLGRYNDLNIEQIISEKNKGAAILSSIVDGLVVFDVALKVTGINPAARRMLDLEFSDVTGRSCADILPAGQVCDLMRTAIDSEKSPDIPDEQRIISFEGGDRSPHYIFSITLIRGRDRRLSGIVLLLRDVTRLREVERLKSEFVMAASHELRSPLTGLGMSIDLLLERLSSGLGEKDLELLQAAHEEVHRMKAMVGDLLDLSKIETGRIEMEFESIQVKTLFSLAESLFKSQADMRGVSIVIEPAKNLRAVRADANKITWVLTNLISNALRYVERGGRIRLKAADIGPHVHISVSDDGPGIPLEYQSKIFQKFVQIKGREPGGTGLGLAICREIVRAHGGAIWVESSPGQGSTFTFTLPTAAGPALPSF